MNLFIIALNPFREFLCNTLCYASDELYQELHLMLNYFRINFSIQFQELMVDGSVKPITQFLREASPLDCHAVCNLVSVPLVNKNVIQQVHERCIYWIKEMKEKKIPVEVEAML